MPGFTEEIVEVGGAKVHTLKGGSGEPLLLLHGAGGNSGWLRYVDALAEHYTVYYPLASRLRAVQPPRLDGKHPRHGRVLYLVSGHPGAGRRQRHRLLHGRLDCRRNRGHLLQRHWQADAGGRRWREAPRGRNRRHFHHQPGPSAGIARGSTTRSTGGGLPDAPMARELSPESS